MRITTLFVHLLVVALLFALPVVSINAEPPKASPEYVWDGASDRPGVTSVVLPSALPATGMAASGYVWDGASDWPGVTTIALPAALPAAGRATQGNVWDGASDWPGVTSIIVPPALPAAGRATQGDAWDGASDRPGVTTIVLASTLPVAGYDEASALRSAYAELRSRGEPTPAGLPVTGMPSGVAIVGFHFDGVTYVPDWAAPAPLVSGGSFDEVSALRNAYADLRFPGELAPAGLPLTGVPAGASIVGFSFDGLAYVPDFAILAEPEVLPQVGALVDGSTGWDRQTILDEIAASGGDMRGARPEAVPVTDVDLGDLTGSNRQAIADAVTASGGTIASAVGPAILPLTGMAPLTPHGLLDVAHYEIEASRGAARWQ